MDNHLTIEEFLDVRYPTIIPHLRSSIIEYHNCVVNQVPCTVFARQTGKKLAISIIREYANYLNEWADEKEDSFECEAENISDSNGQSF